MTGRIRDELIAMLDAALGDEAKEALIAARQLQEEVTWLVERAVALARVNGYDWGRIGRLLAMTRQGARKRFKTAPPRLPPHLVARNRYLAEQRAAEQLLRRLGSGAGRQDDEDDVVPW